MKSLEKTSFKFSDEHKLKNAKTTLYCIINGHSHQILYNISKQKF